MSKCGGIIGGLGFELSRIRGGWVVITGVLGFEMRGSGAWQGCSLLLGVKQAVPRVPPPPPHHPSEGHAV